MTDSSELPPELLQSILQHLVPVSKRPTPSDYAPLYNTCCAGSTLLRDIAQPLLYKRVHVGVTHPGDARRRVLALILAYETRPELRDATIELRLCGPMLLKDQDWTLQFQSSGIELSLPLMSAANSIELAIASQAGPGVGGLCGSTWETEQDGSIFRRMLPLRNLVELETRPPVDLSLHLQSEMCEQLGLVHGGALPRSSTNSVLSARYISGPRLRSVTFLRKWTKVDKDMCPTQNQIKHIAIGGDAGLDTYDKLPIKLLPHLTSLSVLGYVVPRGVHYHQIFEPIVYRLNHLSLAFLPRWHPDGPDARQLGTWIIRLLPQCTQLQDLRLELVTITPWVELTIRAVPRGIRNWTIVLQPDREQGSIVDLGLLFSRLLLGELKAGRMSDMKRLAVVDREDQSLHSMVTAELVMELVHRNVHLAVDSAPWTPWLDESVSDLESI